jgi:hypothetical protein
METTVLAAEIMATVPCKHTKAYDLIKDAEKSGWVHESKLSGCLERTHKR